MKLNCLLFMTLMAFHAQGFPSPDRYLSVIQNLFSSYHKNNLFDGPSSISAAKIATPIRTIKPTREEMMYYNYYTASINCPFGVRTMECGYCSKIKDDITNYVVLENVNHSTAALVALSEKRKEIVVAYRATTNYWNCVLDATILNISPHGADPIKIHRGFYIATMSLYDRVVKTIGAFRLAKKEYTSYKLVLTGHSLGGAMARVTQFLLLHLKQFPGISMEVYTYGEPRSGNKDYVDFLNNQTVKSARIINRADIVSHLPPTSILGTTIISDYYYHAMNEYWINGDEEKFASRSGYEDPSTANSYGPKYSTTDHSSYFDVKPSVTSAVQGLAVAIFFQPPDILPPIPEPIRNFLDAVTDLHMLAVRAMQG
ncbi:lipase-like [Bradysia coprophila]|uniref:lipase-like n=1 Tax=Bradysia coprophila TaxID=38358 RepID=UPI00187DB8D4|nr:lipase-like [Bradysia coprophila]